MFGSGSIKLGTLFGIPVRLHWTFLVLFYLFVFSWEGSPLAVTLLFLALFGSVLLHELGHSLVARAFGIRVIDITFWPLGGMARMTEMPERPRVEGLVAFAGPAVNFVLASIGMALLVLLGAAGQAEFARACAAFVEINLYLGLFNLIPAFPMDGGRILRALLALRCDWLTATERAVAIGRCVAGALLLGAFVLGYAHGQFLGLALIALFVWIAGGRELFTVRLRHGATPFGRREATPWFRAQTPQPATVEVGPEPRGARRPEHWQFRAGSGFDEDAIRDLERFRGRLRHTPEE